MFVFYEAINHKFNYIYKKKYSIVICIFEHICYKKYIVCDGRVCHDVCVYILVSLTL